MSGQVNAVYEDGYTTVQRTLPDYGLQPRDGPDSLETWGLGRLSHRDPGNAQYILESPIRTYLYCLDTGVRITHKEFGGRAIWGANFVENSLVCCYPKLHDACS